MFKSVNLIDLEWRRAQLLGPGPAPMIFFPSLGPGGRPAEHQNADTDLSPALTLTLFTSHTANSLRFILHCRDITTIDIVTVPCQ